MTLTAGAAPHPRDPLAVQLGEVAVPGLPAAPARHAPSELFLRTPPDSLVIALMDSTSVDNMVETIVHLQDYGTRYVALQSCWDAGYWIRDQFEGFGYADVRLDTFRTMTFQDSVDAMNVIAVKEGVTRPSEYVVIGGHYDSVSAENFQDPFAPAPGAEDNATAVAAVFEAARLLRDVSTDRSIMFACWSAEEVGLWGSRHFVASAVAESLDIVVYLNMDCIGYLEPSPDEPPVTVFTDSLSLAIAGYMQTLANEHAGYEAQTRIQPIGASDHTSFWEARYNVVDTGTTISSPYRHTADDVIENIDPDLARAIAAVNVAATAAVAGVLGEDPNLPPETVRISNCAASTSPVTMRPTFEWYGVDFDGEVTSFEYSLAPGEWMPLPAHQTELTIEGLSEGGHTLEIRAVDDNGTVDPSPALYEFTTDASLRPSLTVALNFHPGAQVFLGADAGTCARPFVVFEGERLVFRAVSDASSYCGRADSVAYAISDTSAWSEWHQSPHEVVLRPGPADTAVFFATRDENGAVTSGRVSLRTVPAPMDRPLLRVDDWFTGDIPDAEHDAFYEEVLAGESCDVWDPFEHIVDYVPTLPPMEELGRYRTVMWTLDATGGFLRTAQAEDTYHCLEGYVRAGGNVLLEGQGSLSTIAALSEYQPEATFGPGHFVHDHVGIDSVRNAGSHPNPSNPEQYGYAFLGGIAAGACGLPDAPVDTLGKWSDGYATYGGLPRCEVVRATDGTQVLYLFDSYLNPALDGRPCATARFPGDGTGAFVYFGFPLYYIETVPAGAALAATLDAIEDWQEPAVLSCFTWDAAPDSIALRWCLDSAAEALGCQLARADEGQPGVYAPLHDGLLVPTDGGEYRFVDGSVQPATAYSYRLTVTERWGGTTVHGPWEVVSPARSSAAWLAPPTPNPFSGDVTIRYRLPADSPSVSIDVFDVAGRLVRTLREGPADAGEHDATWDGTGDQGRRVASGVYFVRAQVAETTLERKVVLLN
jgi:hypothetical protein